MFLLFKHVITAWEDTINSLKTSTDEYAFEAEEKLTNAEIKNLISKSNALRRAATEKQNFLDSLSGKYVYYVSFIKLYIIVTILLFQHSCSL